jgi:hypothetical protein
MDYIPVGQRPKDTWVILPWQVIDRTTPDKATGGLVWCSHLVMQLQIIKDVMLEGGTNLGKKIFLWVTAPEMGWSMKQPSESAVEQ